jgi:hypothetical protein
VTQKGEERRRHAAKADAESSFKTLLSEVVKDPNKRWVDVKVRPHCTCIDFQVSGWVTACGGALIPDGGSTC